MFETFQLVVNGVAQPPITTARILMAEYDELKAAQKENSDLRSRNAMLLEQARHCEELKGLLEKYQHDATTHATEMTSLIAENKKLAAQVSELEARLSDLPLLRAELAELKVWKKKEEAQKRKAHNKLLCGAIAYAISARLFTAVWAPGRRRSDLLVLRRKLRTLPEMAEAASKDPTLLDRWNSTIQRFCNARTPPIEHDDFIEHIELLRTQRNEQAHPSCLFEHIDEDDPPVPTPAELQAIVNATFSAKDHKALRAAVSASIDILNGLSREQTVDLLADSC